MAIVRIGVLVLSLLLTALGYVLGTCGASAACPWYTSLAPYSLTLFEPLYLYSLFAIPAGLVLLFVKDAGMRRWLSFARRYVPLSVLILILVPAHESSSLPLYSLTKEGVALALGIGLLCGSLFFVCTTKPERAN